MNDQASSSYTRKLARHIIEGVVEVYDTLRDAYLGRLVNIHSEGLMLIGEKTVDADKLYQLDLHLPQMVNGHGIIHIGVDCLWVRETDEHGSYWSGFHIIDCSEQARADIEHLIVLLGS